MGTPRVFGPPPIALAHRGGSTYGPNLGVENTTAAFARALALGYVHLETDVHVTRDGVLLALHDERLDRVADMTGEVCRLTHEEVSLARIGGREPVPTMDGLLAAFPQARFTIDLKSAGTPRALWRVLVAAKACNRVCVGSFSVARLWAFRALARGRVATSAGPLGVAWLRFAPGWLSRWVHSPGVAYQVPVRWPVLGREVRVVTPGFVAAAHRIGRQVHVWTIDEADEMAALLDLGVDGLVSDAVDVLAEVLARRGAWPPEPCE